MTSFAQPNWMSKNKTGEIITIDDRTTNWTFFVWTVCAVAELSNWKCQQKSTVNFHYTLDTNSKNIPSSVKHGISFNVFQSKYKNSLSIANLFCKFFQFV